MKLTRLIASAALLAIGVNGLAPERQVLITYPEDTPKATLDDAKSNIVAMGGHILHEFKLIKGFVVLTTTKALHSLSSLSLEYKPTIEDDGSVHTVDV